MHSRPGRFGLHIDAVEKVIQGAFLDDDGRRSIFERLRQPEDAAVKPLCAA